MAADDVLGKVGRFGAAQRFTLLARPAQLAGDRKNVVATHRIPGQPRVKAAVLVVELARLLVERTRIAGRAAVLHGEAERDAVDAVARLAAGTAACRVVADLERVTLAISRNASIRTLTGIS